jgi:hypothetical protein
VASTIGCNGGSLESQVSGTVTLDGKSIGNGMIVFVPIDAKGNPPFGNIDASGNYSLKTGRTPGLLPGRYQVVVDIREQQPNFKPGDRPPPGKLLIPEKYNSASTSGLEYQVEPGSNTIDIPLTSQ